MKNVMYTIAAPRYLIACEGNEPGSNTASNVDDIDPERLKAITARANRDAERRHRDELERERRERQAAQDRVRQLEEENAQRSPAPNQDGAALERMTRQLEETNRVVNDWAARARATELVAYRERAIRSVIEAGEQLLEELVVGNSESEIDASIDRAIDAYKRVEARIRKSTELRQPQVPAQQPVVPQAPVAVVPVNPVYPAHVVAGQYGGLPTPVNPQAVVEQVPSVNLQELTTEQAVRSGRYSGQLREQILGQIASGGYGVLGNQPRHMSGVQYASMPGGVQQPLGNPSGPVANPRYAQPPQGQVQQVQVQPQYVQPQYVQPVQQTAVNDLRSRAQEAINRTMNGQNPVAGEAERTIVAQGQTHLANSGISDHQAAFSQRFAPSPPIQPQ